MMYSIPDMLVIAAAIVLPLAGLAVYIARLIRGRRSSCCSGNGNRKGVKCRCGDPD